MGKRTLKALKYAADHNFNTAIRWAICLHGIDSTTRSKNFSNKIIETNPSMTIEFNELSKRLSMPKKFSLLAFLLINFSDFILNAEKSNQI